MALIRMAGRTSVAQKITLIGGAFLFTVIASICAVMSVMLSKRAQERTVSWADAKVETVARALDAYDQTARMLVERSFKVFGDQFGRAFALDESASKLSQLGISLVDYHNPCDKFTDFTGGVAAVLMKKGTDFVVISTSLKDAKGERAMGLTIKPGHPAHAAIARGQAYLGRDVLFGKPYITRYEPARDLQGQVVGALFIAFDLSDFDRSLDQLVTQTRFFDTGGVYVIDPRGGAEQAVLLLPAALRGRRLAEVAGAGRSVIAAAREAEAPGAELDDFKPVLRPAATDRFAVARSGATGTMVVAELSHTEAMRSQWLTLAPFLLLFGLAAIALCAGQYVMIRRWVGRPLNSLTRALECVSAGDLSQPVATGQRDEIGDMIRAVETMRVRFVEMLGAVRQAAEAISLASEEIASGNQDLSQRTELAAASLQQTSASMRQVYDSVQRAADAARQADELAGTASQAAERGGAAVANVVGRMGRISSASQRIADITSVIDAIAFQTNILALNAAVEAARAGAAGRGFAVVAGEVRALAHRASDAAREIKGLIESSVEEVASGSALAGTASARMQEIDASVHRVADIMAAITTSSAAQSGELGHIHASVSRLDHMTQSNSALVEQSAAAAASLNEQASVLVRAVSQFRLESAPA
jgi:methyl-accepting chemotaxis protein-2 (aspartate sensor receptor)